MENKETIKLTIEQWFKFLALSKQGIDLAERAVIERFVGNESVLRQLIADIINQKIAFDKDWAALKEECKRNK